MWDGGDHAQFKYARHGMGIAEVHLQEQDGLCEIEDEKAHKVEATVTDLAWAVAARRKFWHAQYMVGEALFKRSSDDDGERSRQGAPLLYQATPSWMSVLLPGTLKIPSQAGPKANTSVIARAQHKF